MKQNTVIRQGKDFIVVNRSILVPDLNPLWRISTFIVNDAPGAVGWVGVLALCPQRQPEAFGFSIAIGPRFPKNIRGIIRQTFRAELGGDKITIHPKTDPVLCSFLNDHSFTYDIYVLDSRRVGNLSAVEAKRLLRDLEGFGGTLSEKAKRLATEFIDLMDIDCLKAGERAQALRFGKFGIPQGRGRGASGEVVPFQRPKRERDE